MCDAGLSGLSDWERELVDLVDAENPGMHARAQLMDGENAAATELYRRLCAMGFIGGLDADDAFTFAGINKAGYDHVRRIRGEA